MLLLIIFAFLAGIVTILSPCILPVLPIVLAGSVSGGKRKPFGIVVGFIFSFTFFTLALSSIVKLTGLPSDSLRTLSVVIILTFGISLLIPKTQVLLEGWFSKLANLTPKTQSSSPSFWAGVVIGLSLGLVWTPCVGPIIASVITLAATNSVNASTVIITLAYSLGTAIPMLIIMQGGRALFAKVPWLLPNSAKIQKGFGVVMIVVSLAIFFNFDRQFQNYILTVFPQYGTGLTQIETNSVVQNALQNLKSTPKPELSTTTENSGGAPDFIAGGKWFNSDPLTISSLRGKVVLVDFWTYTCINCIRTLPHLKDWYQKYHDMGLVIVGVHTPEFEFEKDSNNVAKAISDFGIKYPVVQDNNYATWQAYNNQYWPAEYLIDAKGQIRHTHFGEGEYDQTEQAIQGLLKEAGDQKADMPISHLPDQTPENEISPETYLGSKRMEYYFPSGILKNGQQSFNLSNLLPDDSFSYGGTWTINDDNATAGPQATLDYNFTADKVFIILRPGQTPKGGTVKVYLDTQAIDPSVAGQDVHNGIVTVDSDRLYNIVDLHGKTEKHVVKLEFQTPGLEAYTFTFG